MRMQKILIYIFLFSLTSLVKATDFTDIDHSPYSTAIKELNKKGWVAGYADKTFKAAQSINRAEFVKILVATKYQRQADSQAQSDKSCFSDIPSPAWYRPYVCVAQERKIITGYADGSFRPENVVNKAEAAKILYEFYFFADPVKKESPWYRAYYEGLEKKRAFFTFFDEAPESPLSRGQMAFAIQQFSQYPAVSLSPPAPKFSTELVFNKPRTLTPMVDVSPTPLPAPAPITPIIQNPRVTFPATPPVSNSQPNLEVSPLYVVSSRHPGSQVSGGYISSYSQWQAASYPASKSNKTLDRAEAHQIGNLVLKRVNDARIATNRDRLQFNADLQDVAQNFAEHLVINAVYSHSDKLGHDPFERAKLAGIPGFVAESIVWGRRDPQTAIGWWKNSATHWNNVSNSRFKQAGVGVTKEPTGGYIVVLFEGE